MPADASKSLGFNGDIPNMVTILSLQLQLLPFDFEGKKNDNTSNHSSHVLLRAVLGRGRFRGDRVAMKDWDMQ